MNHLKCFIILSILSICNSVARELSLKIILSDCSQTGVDHIFLENDNPSFYIENINDDNFEWELFLVDDNKGNTVLIPLERTNKSSFSLETSKYKDYFIKCSHFDIQGDQKLHVCKLRVSYQDITSEYILRFNLCPSKPLIYSGEFHSEWLRELCFYDITGDDVLQLYLETNRADRIKFFYTQMNMFEEDFDLNKIHFPISQTVPLSSDTNTHCVNVNVDWGAYICAYSSNQYGSSIRSDTIFTTAFVDDPNVIEDILKYKQTLQSSLNDVTIKSQPHISLIDTSLHIVGLTMTSCVLIYSLSGNKIYHECNSSNTIDISGFSPGVYIGCIDTDGRKYFFKFKL